MTALEITIPDALIDAIADRLEARLQTGAPVSSRWLTVRDAAQHLGLSQNSLRALIKRQRIPFYKVEGRILLERTELDAWVRGGACST